MCLDGSKTEMLQEKGRKLIKSYKRIRQETWDFTPPLHHNSIKTTTAAIFFIYKERKYLQIKNLLPVTKHEFPFQQDNYYKKNNKKNSYKKTPTFPSGIHKQQKLLEI